MKSTEFKNFDAAMRKLVSVPHDEIKAKLDAEKRAKKKPSKKRASSRASGGKGNGLKNETKAIVVGALDRKKGKVRAEVVLNRGIAVLDKFVQKNVKKGSTIYSDDHVGYMNLRFLYNHDKLNKQVEGYIKGKVHTQGIENFWALLKRGLGGTYVAVEPFHLFRYLDEQVFRFNNR